MGNSEETEQQAPSEQAEKVYINLPRATLAQLEYIATLTRKSRTRMITDLLRWGLESIDPNTEELPDVHPSTNRPTNEVLSSTPDLRSRIRSVTTRT